MKEIIPISELFEDPDDGPTETELSKAVAKLLEETKGGDKEEELRDGQVEKPQSVGLPETFFLQWFFEYLYVKVRENSKNHV